MYIGGFWVLDVNRSVCWWIDGFWGAIGSQDPSNFQKEDV